MPKKRGPGRPRKPGRPKGSKNKKSTKRKRLSVISQSPTGRNKRFRDNKTKRSYNRSEINKMIRKGTYKNYHLRKINGKWTPVSNPDSSKYNNLG